VAPFSDRTHSGKPSRRLKFSEIIAEALDQPLRRMRPLSGGDVADAYQVWLDDGTTVFAKTKQNALPGFFDTEAASLRWLRDTGTVAVPRVLAVSDDPPFLILEWIDAGHAHDQTEADLGRALGCLHQTPTQFGRQDKRTTGSRGLPNEPSTSWAEFYKTQRLLPLAKIAAAESALPTATIADVHRIADRLDTYGATDEPAALLHGDLWGGNRLVGVAGVNWLIDPASHGGHREFDLAMMRLFGGFEQACFDAYDDEYPLADGWRERIPLHQLAPLMVHAIKFGGGYVASTRAATRLL
jgi:fructosamine-3-kinase